MANSSQFVLPTITAPALLEAPHDRGVVGRHVVAQHARASGGRHAGETQVVLDARSARRAAACRDASVRGPLLSRAPQPARRCTV